MSKQEKESYFKSFRQAVLKAANNYRTHGSFCGKRFDIYGTVITLNGSYVCCISELL